MKNTITKSLRREYKIEPSVSRLEYYDTFMVATLLSPLPLASHMAEDKKRPELHLTLAGDEHTFAR